MVLAGAGQITGGDAAGGVAVAAGETVLLPAGLTPRDLLVADEMTVLEITLPERPPGNGQD